MSLTYDNLKIYPYELVRLSDLSMKKQINEHTRLRFTGIVSEEKKGSYVEMTEANTPVELYQVDEDGGSKPLFRGMALSIEINVIRGVYYVEVEAVSHTYLMDVKRKTRSFQNVHITIPEMLNAIGEDYPGLDVIDEATGGAKLSRFALQYNETDWEFLRRMASRYHTSLMPASQFDKPKFYFGIFEGDAAVRMDQGNYTVRKRVEPFRYFTENEMAKVNEDDFITYEIETDRVLELGSHVFFKGKSLFVCEAYTAMTDGIVQHHYVLCPHKGLRQKAYDNENMIGASIHGRVIGVAGDKVKVHFEFDPEQNIEEARWFRYSSMYTAEGSTGWYVMPEMGDPVTVYFPGSKEEEGIAGGAARQQTRTGENDKLNNPEVKIFRTPYGKEIMLAPDEVVITGKEGAIYIRLNEQEGIHIASSKNISITADGDITMNAAKKVVLSAGSEMNLSCKGSQLHLGGHASLTGATVNSN
ncbi:contractile injection system protein, VgrG/Pvc8 family [Paenibacillus thiaminolyticus]|uniref:Contractile injection system protein, VgrG/Pvc8 family n=1 Tax=Paenibacillus thiaminolyticus TaxID=49283 RepID=A0AAP9DUV0_PANTH|nr:contractile injection system protein, VgrG/Pvc8 family [Paenibacillus thiaminolyticus]MCY9535125.1 contractile injection system protein, VgrG/Pvc8 family [Paenibacillus thiaminolyticus]MCY9605278.1 contractile injection system protein, VgrG/Pvc8 family [Paenibacillus thiaminolyticus]MCY9609125.1 contractile injection system protein, VgrG/Pvc8 family [Paenibacillus thiaminolyticus]MCY9614155.1 contractile injection system protein, VgrG/Pvc8 family [Paenibacillus thiaminolyticus]MCY9620388.1 